MSTYIFGVDLYDHSRKSTLLLRELSNAGFKRFETIKDPKELTFKDGGYVLAFGAMALLSMTGAGMRMAEERGKMHPCIFNESVLVFATYAPGFITGRDRSALPLLRDDLALFKTFIDLDRTGVVH